MCIEKNTQKNSSPTEVFEFLVVLVYFISEVLPDSKIRYPRVQMLLYAILMLSASYATTSISRCHIL